MNRLLEKGRENMHNYAESVQLKIPIIDANVDRLKTFVRLDRRSSVQQIAEEIIINKQTVQLIIRGDLEMRNNFLKVNFVNLDWWAETMPASGFDFLNNVELFDRIMQ